MLGIGGIDVKQTRFYQDGLPEGRQEGRQIGEALVLRRILTHRFGPQPEWFEQRIVQKAPPERLEAWAERLLDAENLAAILEA